MSEKIDYSKGVYDARQLGAGRMFILGVQHMFAMFGATILVPILVNSYFVDACGEGPSRGLTVSVTLFCAGFGTLLFHLCAKFKVPAFLGSSSSRSLSAANDCTVKQIMRKVITYFDN